MKERASLLKDHGLSVTAQRLAILEIIEKNPHTTADRVIELCCKKLGSISKQAVYTVLMTFTEHGIIRRIQPSKSPALYESRTGDNHHHLICRRCGKIHDVDCAKDDTPCLTPIKNYGFIVDEAEVIYWGYCQNCQN